MADSQSAASAVKYGPWAAQEARTRGASAGTLGLFAAGGVIWFLRALGALGAGEPAWVYAVVGIDLALPALLVLELSRARQLAQLGALAQLTVALALTEGDFHRALPWLFAGHAAALFASVAVSLEGRVGHVVAALGTACAASALLFGDTPHFRKGVDVPILGRRAMLHLPVGYATIGVDQLGGVRRLPVVASTWETVAFVNRGRGTTGLVIIAPNASDQLISDCQERLSALGAMEVLVPVPGQALMALGGPGLRYRFRTASGAHGQGACARPRSGQFVTLLVTGPTLTAASRALAEVASGIALR